LFSHVCEYCGKEYQDRQKKQEATFCSHNCYIRYRFYQDEDIERLITALRERQPIDDVPYWIRRLLLGNKIG
jgi:hydrogenase maturation factor HypF (carbamoyltransferase family)